MPAQHSGACHTAPRAPTGTDASSAVGGCARRPQMRAPVDRWRGAQRAGHLVEPVEDRSGLREAPARLHSTCGVTRSQIGSIRQSPARSGAGG
eukprot:4865390-Prymnesium_polylepis.1